MEEELKNAPEETVIVSSTLYQVPVFVKILKFLSLVKKVGPLFIHSGGFFIFQTSIAGDITAALEIPKHELVKFVFNYEDPVCCQIDLQELQLNLSPVKLDDPAGILIRS